MIDQEEIELIISTIEGHQERQVQERKKHWPRRIGIICGVLVIGVVIQEVIDDYGLRSAAHSAELLVASLIEAAFNKGREV
jgi:hypothetical protein